MIPDNYSSSNKVVGEIRHILNENKAQDIVVINLCGKSGIFDYMVVASGTSHRHIHSLAEKLAFFFKYSKGTKVEIEGSPNSDWLLLDTIDVVVHIFKPEIRSFYNIESLWDSDFTSAIASG